MLTPMILKFVESRSTPGLKYEMRLGKDGVVYCTCPAWKFSGTGNCKHLAAFEGRLQPVRQPVLA